MDDAITKSATEISRVEHCSYCGAKLNYSFYFCVACATPYKPLVDVIGPLIPRELTESELIQKKAPNVWVVFWSYAIILFVGFLFHNMIEGEQEDLYTFIFFTVAIIGATIVFEVIYWRSLAVQLKNFGFLKKEAWIGLLLLGGLLLINLGYTHILTNAFEELEFREERLIGLGFGSVGMFLLFCLMPAITEEIAFRGLIQHWLQTALKPGRAIILASALFTGIHLSVIGAPYLFLVGLLLGWTKWKTGSLYPCMLIHLIHNWVVITVFPLLFN